MDDINIIKKVLQHFSDKSDSEDMYSEFCIVDSVNEAERTCECLPVDESKADLMDVKLMPVIKTGMLIIPKVGSAVIVTHIGKGSGYVAMYSEVEKILLNGDNYGGIPILGNLVTKLNNIESALNTHIAVFNAHIHVETSVNTLVPSVPDTTSVTPTKTSDLENITVKHGNG